jgi:hypothetical protein
MKVIEENGGDIEQLNALARQLPSQNDDASLVPCPYCSRKFNPSKINY